MCSQDEGQEDEQDDAVKGIAHGLQTGWKELAS